MKLSAQETYKAVVFLLGGLFFAGVLYDTVSNAISLITPAVTYWATFLLLVFWGGLEIYVKKKGITWKFEGNQKAKVTGINRQIRLFFVGIILSFWIPVFFGQKEIEKESPPSQALTFQNNSNFQPIFPPDDSTHFNILIIRFEDYIAQENTYCIGRAIQEHLSFIGQQEPLPLSLSTRYAADSIPPPASVEEAEQIQKRHHADLILYGLARNVQEGCSGAEVCFRYNIAEQVITHIAPAIELKVIKHDQEYITTSPLQLEKGMLQIDDFSLKYWITSLVNVKANNADQAFLELDNIANDTSLSIHERASRFLTIGNTYTNYRQYGRAVDAFNQSIELDPGNAFAYNSRGNAYRRLKQYDRAMEDYNRAIELDPESAVAYINSGVAYDELEQYKQAIDNYNQAMQLDPKAVIAYENRATTYANLKQYDRAMEDYSRAIELDPGNAFAYNNRGVVYTDLKQYDRAMEDCNRAIELDPEYALAYNTRAGVYTDLKQYDRAVEDYTLAIKFDPENMAFYYNRGTAYHYLSQVDRAIEDFNRAVTLDPIYAATYNNRGNTYRKMRQYELAVNDFKRVIQLTPGDLSAYVQIAHIYLVKKYWMVTFFVFPLGLCLFFRKKLKTFFVNLTRKKNQA